MWNECSDFKIHELTASEYLIQYFVEVKIEVDIVEMDWYYGMVDDIF